MIDSIYEIQIFKPSFLPCVGTFVMLGFIIYSALQKWILGESKTEKLAEKLRDTVEGLADYYDALDLATRNEFINTEIYYKKRFNI